MTGAMTRGTFAMSFGCLIFASSRIARPTIRLTSGTSSLLSGHGRAEASFAAALSSATACDLSDSGVASCCRAQPLRAPPPTDHPHCCHPAFHARQRDRGVIVPSGPRRRKRPPTRRDGRSPRDRPSRRGLSSRTDDSLGSLRPVATRATLPPSMSRARHRNARH